jgi:hypothetical protein
MNKETITMTKQEAERLLIVNNLIEKRINGTDASKQLNLSVRQIRRMKQRIIKLGAKGIVHSNRGKTGNRKFNNFFIKKVKTIIHEKYSYFTPTMTFEHLRDEEKIGINKETVRQLMIGEKLWIGKKRKVSEYRCQRERKENFGEMEQFDGSYDHWLYEVDEEQCLLASIDDATGKITGAKFEKNEGIIPVFSFWKRYIEEHGKPITIYLDKFSTYKINHKNAEDNKDMLTQFEKAVKELNILLIKANSPQAKGRVERLWRTLQTRLIIEMRHRKIKTVEEANSFLKDEFVPWFNKKFAVVPKGKANLHRINNNNLEEVFSIKKERSVGNDFVVRYENNYYQLEQEQPITVLKKSTVMVETRISGEVRIKQRGEYLNFFVLPEKPKKEIETMVPALVRKKSDWRPPANHPWKAASFKIREVIINSR